MGYGMWGLLGQALSQSDGSVGPRKVPWGVLDQSQQCCPKRHFRVNSNPPERKNSGNQRLWLWLGIEPFQFVAANQKPSCTMAELSQPTN